MFLPTCLDFNFSIRYSSLHSGQQLHKKLEDENIRPKVYLIVLPHLAQIQFALMSFLFVLPSSD